MVYTVRCYLINHTSISMGHQPSKAVLENICPYFIFVVPDKFLWMSQDRITGQKLNYNKTK